MKTPRNKKHALTLSIKKYENLKEKAENDIQISIGEIVGNSCPCCIYSKQNVLFDKEGDEIECPDCLISESTGKSNCDDTPWTRLHCYIYRQAETNFPQIKEDILKHLQREIDFLQQVKKENTE